MTFNLVFNAESLPVVINAQPQLGGNPGLLSEGLPCCCPSTVPVLPPNIDLASNLSPHAKMSSVHTYLQHKHNYMSYLGDVLSFGKRPDIKQDVP